MTQTFAQSSKIFKIIITLALGLIFSVSLAFAHGNHQAKKKEVHKKFTAFSAKTTLSKKAAHLKLGMNKKQVEKILGNPTWADSDSGVPLTLAWKNGNCNPVVVTFNKKMKVDGWDEGRAECLKVAYSHLPGDEYLCARSNRHGMCKALVAVG